VHTFVINLPEDFARREAVAIQLQKLGLSYDLIPAIRGKSLSAEERQEYYDEKWFIRNEGRPALPGELGCALSHIAVYRLIKEQGITHALILEDDAWLNPNLPQLLQAISQKYAPEERNVFLLTWVAELSMSRVDTLWSSYHLGKVKSAVCTHGYVISNAAAEALVQTLHPVRHLADCWTWLRRHRVVNIYAVFPTCVTADLSYETGTTIELRADRPKRPFSKRVMHKAYRAFWWATDHLVAMIQRTPNI
jgi:glycosyl transferase family 25